MTSATQLPAPPAGPEATPAPATGAGRAIGRRLPELAGLALLVVPGLLTAYLALRTGGYYAETSSSVVVLLAAGLAVHALAARRPLAGLSTPLVVAGAAMALLVAWTWLSANWSDAPGRAVLESQRTALYLLALVLFGAAVRRRGGVAVAAGAVAVAIVGVCAAAVATRLYPDVFEVAPTLSSARLSFPISYWNSLGLFAGVGLVLSLHFACHHHSRVTARVLGAAGVPLAAAAIYFTFSRGAAAATVVGVLAYLLVGRPRGALAGLIATVPTTLLTLRAAYDADLLGTRENTTAAAAAQGHEVATMLIVCCLAAAVFRLALVPLDTRLTRIPRPRPMRRGTAVAVIAVLAMLAGSAALAADVPDRIERGYHSFTEGEKSDDARTRFRSVRIGGRSDHWDVALDNYRAHKLAGTGAGTYETRWLAERSDPSETAEAHSLYIEMLAELGIVGFVLVVTAIVAILAGLLWRARGRRRPVYAALFAAILMWALHAGVDWDWELPAVSLWAFALAGVALANGTAGQRGPRPRSAWPLRIAIGLACLVVGVTGLRAVISDAALDDARAAADDGDCALVRSNALQSASALGSRAEPFELLGYCEIDAGRDRAALRAMREAVSLDPDHWRYRYGLALARGAAGLDPRPELRRARRLNPLGSIARTGAAAQLVRSGPRDWERLATEASRPSN
jgi:O-Antigen ligase